MLLGLLRKDGSTLIRFTKKEKRKRKQNSLHEVSQKMVSI